MTNKEKIDGLEAIPIHSISAADGIAADSVLANGDRPEQFAEYCQRLIAGMTPLSLTEARGLPDGVAQDVYLRCQERRDEDQEIARKNLPARLSGRATVSVTNSASTTQSNGSDESQNGNSSAGSSSSDRVQTIIEANGPTA